MKWTEFPDAIDDESGQALLAKTYRKEGLSDLDRYHAKLGDVGLKAMKKALPNLKIPKGMTKYRCECCIEGKIHKFGHPKCAEGDRTEYLPGACIHSDHSGPYAYSLGVTGILNCFLIVVQVISGLFAWPRKLDITPQLQR
jgi:hypothetical protein